VAGRFGLVACAGEFGTAWSVLPWPTGEARKAAAQCFRDWLDARGGSGATEVTAGLAQVRAFFQVNGAARFETWGESSQDIKTINRAGFRRKDETTGEWSFYVFQDVFKTEVCQGQNHMMILRELKTRGLLLTQEARGLTVKPRIPGVGSGLRFYHFPPAILGSDAEPSVPQQQVGTVGTGRDTLSSPGSGCPYPEINRSGRSGQPVALMKFVPTCPAADNGEAGQLQPSNGAVSLSVPTVPTPNGMKQENQSVPMWGGPAEVEI